MRRIHHLIATFIAATALGAVPPAQTPRASAREPHADFGKAVRGAVVEHTFTLDNHGDTPLGIRRIRLTPPMVPGDIPPVLPPRQQGALRVRLDTRSLDGPFEGFVLLSFEDPAVPDLRLTVTGHVVPAVEVLPPAIFASARRGEASRFSVEIVSHEPEPVLIGVVRHAPERFTTTLETIEEGRRYRLKLALKPDGPGGRGRETIRIRTSSAAVPELRIPAFTYLHERVYTFPDDVDLGVVRLEDIRRRPSAQPEQILMVYRKGTTDFRVTVSTDVPHLAIHAERGPLGDRYQITVTVATDRALPGPIRGRIVIETNDPEFPTLSVPVSGEIVGGA